jgi:hypothetical protein
MGEDKKVDLTFDLIQSTIIERENKLSREVYEMNKLDSDADSWSRVGLLEGLEERESKILSIFFSEAYRLIEHGVIISTAGDQNLIVLFPILRRLFSNNKLREVYRRKSFYSDIRSKVPIVLIAINQHLNEFWCSESVKNILSELKAVSSTNVDAEAELVAFYCNTFKYSDIKGKIQKLKNHYNSPEYKQSLINLENLLNRG